MKDNESEISISLFQTPNGVWTDSSGSWHCYYSIDSPYPFEIGRGSIIQVSGWIFHIHEKISGIQLLLGNEVFSLTIYPVIQDLIKNNAGLPEYYTSTGIFSGFIGTITVIEYHEDSVLSIRVKINGNQVIRVNLGLFRTTKQNEECPEIYDIQKKAASWFRSHQCDNEPPVVICCATYQPDLALFSRQIHSLIHQTYKNWICIINDDGSSDEIFSAIESCLAGHEQFILRRNLNNLGFYKNFEILIRMVPKEAMFVALCDQDDYWFPDKVTKCVAAFQERTTLVYSDLRIVDAKGRVIHPTFWTTRKNEFKDLRLLILANTVTGAATVFKANLIPWLVPFPTLQGWAFHDHWIACMSLALGEIRYIDEPLYDYTQHGRNIIGQATFDSSGIQRYLNFFHRLFNVSALLHTIITSQHFFQTEGLRLFHIASTIKARCGCNVRSDVKKAITLYCSMPVHSRHLFVLTLRNIFMRRSVNMADIRLFFSIWTTKLNKFPPFRKFATIFISGTGNADTPVFVKRKISPLNLLKMQDEPARVNLLIPEIGFTYLFGGYIAKFNLAKKLVEEGRLVRIILVDQSSVEEESIRHLFSQYPGLEDLPDKIEIIPAGDRARFIRVSPQDSFIATTWWTAHIAHSAALAIGTKGFIYLIQEYEPFTFPMGSFFALANQSYQFPHYAVFSTELLREFFRISQIGVFSGENGENCSCSFQNAVKKHPGLKIEKRPGMKKLLFYARPEPHAARNLYQLGMIALEQAVRKSILKEADWEFFAIGSVGGSERYQLTPTCYLKVLPKMDLDGYYEQIKQYDLGIALMYTPHPSLTPLDMAAAGMVVVTTTCLNKSREDLAAISGNIIGAEPTINGIEEGISEAVSRLGNIGNRERESDIRWAGTWEEAFSKEVMIKIARYLDYQEYIS